ncbi:MAG: hypothetical protein FWE65_00410 [Eggerthellaceae bacterium]|nr:hypothetical protein [Eggerthellaceae bacterium]
MQNPEPLIPGVTAELFPLSSQCIACHNNIVTDGGAHYSFVEDWFNSIHGQSSVDPIYLAMVRRETLVLPSAADEIQATCAACHLPVADMAAIALGLSQSFLDNSSKTDHVLYEQYRDGGSCMFCHQLTSVPTEGNTKFRTTSMSVNLHQSPAGETRTLYGYHPSSVSAQQPMINAIGYSTLPNFIERTELICTVCHTLYTDAFTVDGKPAGTRLPEQVISLEWMAWSDWSTHSCQSCHMPVNVPLGPLASYKTEDPTQGRIATHSFVGANSYLLKLVGSDGSLDKGIAATTEYLQSKTATLALKGSYSDASSSLLELDVLLTSLSGHKFPTGFPSRRAWLHVQVLDDSGAVLYESGAYDSKGMILDNNSDLDKSSFEPHYMVIDQPGQVQIYEAIMMDSNGNPTTNLLQGVDYLKDNRVIPTGFNKFNLRGDTAVVGEAMDDEDFIGARDTTFYKISLPAGTGNVTIKVELLYQTVGYRFMEDLLSYPSAEQQALAKLVEETPNLPVLITSQEIKVSR